jgi:hypothetical protein
MMSIERQATEIKNAMGRPKRINQYDVANPLIK